MRILRKVLIGILILVLLYCALLLVERMTSQELTRVTDAATKESACLMWKPRLLRGDGVCSLALVNAGDEVVDTARLGTLNKGFDALQEFGQLRFQEKTITVANRQTGEVVRRFAVRDGRLSPQK